MKKITLPFLRNSFRFWSDEPLECYQNLILTFSTEEPLEHPFAFFLTRKVKNENMIQPIGHSFLL